jgi:hypothetical protein
MEDVLLRLKNFIIARLPRCFLEDSSLHMLIIAFFHVPFWWLIIWMNEAQLEFLRPKESERSLWKYGRFTFLSLVK